MTVRDTVWPLDDHTRGKHLVLRYYLDAWLPILGTSRGKVVFIDGFAGPGEYVGGEDGSPLIALRALAEHSHRARIPEVRFLFIEERRDRADHLRALVNRRFPELPAGWLWDVVNAECAPTVLGLLENLESAGTRLAPSLMMLDPFGVKGVPMELVRRFLRHPGTEVYISFMYESFHRFYEHPEFREPLDELFGEGTWRETLALPSCEEARRATYSLYERCLRAAGARYVLHFDIHRGGRLIYSVFFATKSPKGCDKMKAAMWRAAPDGSFEFRGQRGGQMLLRLGGPNYAVLRAEILDMLKSQGSLTMRELKEYLQSDLTLFHSEQPYKRKVLRPMEAEGLIAPRRPPGTRRNTFTDAVVLELP